MGFSSPNYTQTPNDLFDVLMSEMGDAELRVVLAVVRKTFGYHKERTGDEISLTQIQKMTGLSRQGALDGITQAIEHGHIEECGQGKRGVKRYRPVILDDQSNDTTGQATRPDNNATGQATRPVNEATGQATRPVNEATGQASRHTKERVFKENSLSKEKRLEREISHSQNDAASMEQGNPDSEASNRIKATIQAWASGLGDAAPPRTDTPQNRDAAELLVQRGYTPDDVYEYVKQEFNGAYWQNGKGKGGYPKLSTVADRIGAWKQERQKRQARDARRKQNWIATPDEELPYGTILFNAQGEITTAVGDPNSDEELRGRIAASVKAAGFRVIWKPVAAREEELAKQRQLLARLRQG